MALQRLFMGIDFRGSAIQDAGNGLTNDLRGRP